MEKIKIEKGDRFGKLVIVERLSIKDGRYYSCICDCGKESISYRSNLVTGKTKSCGCGRGYFRESKYGEIKGLEKMKSSHHNMIQRCKNPKHEQFEYYGGRGISVCDRWLDKKTFIEDMKNSWFEGAEIDRINANGNYEPSNCKWSTRAEQMTNRRCSIHVEYQGKTWSIPELAASINMHPNTLYNRITREWPLEDAINKPVRFK